MIKLYICCLVLFIGILIVGPDIDIKFLHGDKDVKHDNIFIFSTSNNNVKLPMYEEHTITPASDRCFDHLVVTVIEKNLRLFFNSLNKISKLNGNGILVSVIDCTLFELN